MRNFQLIGQVDVIPLQLALQTRKHLWNEFPFRTEYTNTPHAEADDILVRFSDREKIADPERIEQVLADTDPVFFPAWDQLPQIRPIVFDLMRRVEAVSLGRIVISRLEPGAKIAPHADTSGDYCTQGRGVRLHVPIQGLPGSLYHCGDETVCMQTGQVWWFNHLQVHRVENNSADDRIHLMIDMVCA